MTKVNVYPKFSFRCPVCNEVNRNIEVKKSMFKNKQKAQCNYCNHEVVVIPIRR